MKIRYCIAPALLGLFLSLTACVEKTPVVEETAPAIKILKGEMMLPPTGGEDAFLFESENEVKAVADWVSPYPGGHCLRHFIETVMRAQGRWNYDEALYKKSF